MGLTGAAGYQPCTAKGAESMHNAGAEEYTTGNSQGLRYNKLVLFATPVARLNRQEVDAESLEDAGQVVSPAASQDDEHKRGPVE